MMLKALITTAAIATAHAVPAAPASAPLLDIKPYAITMSVPNIETTAEWYGEILGFKIDKTKSYPEFKTRLAFLEREGFSVELIEDAAAKPGPVRPDAPAHTAIHGFSQFMFQTTDLAKVKAALAAKGIPIHFEFENAELGVRFFFIRDPNMNLITFVQRL
jgi:catechol 2,3-dioxygenase-like lactoylglutathione lyase family enzyme